MSEGIFDKFLRECAEDSINARPGEPQEQECPECDGRGKWFPAPHNTIYDPDCPRCKGTGRL